MRFRHRCSGRSAVAHRRFVREDILRPDGDASFFASANPVAFLERQDENFSVTDLAGSFGLAGFENGLDGRLDIIRR